MLLSNRHPDPIAHLQNMLSHMLAIPRHSSIGGALRERSSSSSMTELYAFRSSSYFSGWSESTEPAMAKWARCLLGKVQENDRPDRNTCLWDVPAEETRQRMCQLACVSPYSRHGMA